MRDHWAAPCLQCISSRIAVVVGHIQFPKGVPADALLSEERPCATFLPDTKRDDQSKRLIVTLTSRVRRIESATC